MTKRILLTLAALLALAAPAAAQTGTITTNGQCRSIGTGNKGQGTVQISGTWTGTLTWYVSNGPAQAAIDLAAPDTPGTAVNSTTSNGSWQGNVAGWDTFSVCATATMTGTATIWLNASNAGGGGGGGGGGAGTADSTAAKQDSQIALETSILAAVDGLETYSAAIQTATESAATSLSSLLSGLVEVAVDDSPITEPSNSPAIFSAYALGAARSPVDATGDAVLGIATRYGVQKVILTGEDGAKSPIFAEDLAATTADLGIQALAVRADTAASTAANGDYVPLLTDSLGRLWITGSAVEDAGETAGGILNMVGAVQRDAAASSAGTTGDNATINVDALGLLWTRALDPCTAIARTTVPISVTSDTVVISASASKKNYICGGRWVAGAAEIVNLWEGTGSTCGTNSTAIIGSTTEGNGESYAANGGALIPTTIPGIGTNVDTCIRLNGSNRVAGYITYVQAP